MMEIISVNKQPFMSHSCYDYYFRVLEMGKNFISAFRLGCYL